MVAQKTSDSPVKVPIYNVGSIGVIQDVPGHELPPEAWTTGVNIRCRKGNIERMLGHAQIFGTLKGTPNFVFNVPGVSDQTFWFYMTEDTAEANDSSTKIRLELNGTDASTTITDTNTGGAAHVWTARGNAQIDTADYRFDGASLLCDGTGDWVDTPDHADYTLGSGAWTMSFWFKCTAAAGAFRAAAGQVPTTNAAADASIAAVRLDTGEMALEVSDGAAYTLVTGTTKFTDLLNTGWHHYAGVRTGNVLKLFIDGVQEGSSTAFTGAVNNSTQNWNVGQKGQTGNTWTGWIDRFSLSVGVARYTTSPFLVPGQRAYVVESGVHTDVTRAVGDYTAAHRRDWCGTLFGGIPIFTDNADVPQYWSVLSAGTRLAALPNWTATKIAKIIRAFGSYLFALNITESGTNRAHKVLVSHKADPGSVPSSWDPSDPTVDAIEFELIDTTGGELLDGLPLGSVFVAYKKNSTHTIRFVGGSELWARDLLLTNSGILASRCVCEFDNGTKHFVVTQNDIISHSATKDVQKIAEGKNKDTIFAEIDSTNYFNSFVFENKKYKEVWFCYPTTGETTPNKVFIYNYQYNTQYFRDFDGLSAGIGVVSDASGETWAGDSGLWSDDATLWSEAGREAIIFASPNDAMLFKLDSGLAFGADTPVLVLERLGLAITGRDRQGNPKEDFGLRKLVTRIWPKFTGDATWEIQVGSQEYRDAPITWSSAQTFDPQTMQYLDVTTNGRLIGVRVQQEENVYGVFEGYDLRMTLLGEF